MYLYVQQQGYCDKAAIFALEMSFAGSCGKVLTHESPKLLLVCCCHHQHHMQSTAPAKAVLIAMPMCDWPAGESDCLCGATYMTASLQKRGVLAGRMTLSQSMALCLRSLQHHHQRQHTALQMFSQQKHGMCTCQRRLVLAGPHSQHQPTQVTHICLDQQRRLQRQQLLQQGKGKHQQVQPKKGPQCLLLWLHSTSG